MYMLNIFFNILHSILIPKRSQFTYFNNHVEFYLFITGSSSATIENTTNFHTPKKTQSKMITTLTLAIIGVTVVFVILIMMYVYMRLLEKSYVNTNTI